jgi:deoxyhypusine monooxygenase
MSVQVTPAQMDTLKSTLLNTTGSTPLHERFRALFMLKAVNNDEVVKIVAEGKPPCSPASGLADAQDWKTHPHYSNTN